MRRLWIGGVVFLRGFDQTFAIRWDNGENE